MSESPFNCTACHHSYPNAKRVRPVPNHSPPIPSYSFILTTVRNSKLPLVVWVSLNLSQEQIFPTNSLNRCSAECKSKSNLKQHLDKHSNVEYECPFCGKTYVTKRVLQVHLKQKLSCPDCEEYGEKSCTILLTTHILEKHPRRCKVAECEAKGIVFTKDSLLATHNRQRHDEIICDVPGCDRKIKGTQPLRYHKFKGLHKGLVRICRFCEKRFMDFELEEHRKHHFVRKLRKQLKIF